MSFKNTCEGWPNGGQWSHIPISDTPLCRKNFPSFVCTLLQIPYQHGHHSLGGSSLSTSFSECDSWDNLIGEKKGWYGEICPALSHIPIAGMKWLTREDHGWGFELLASAASCLHSALLGNSRSKYYHVACLYSFILSISVLDKISFFDLEPKYDLMKYVTSKYTPSNITLPCNDDFLTVVHC